MMTGPKPDRPLAGVLESVFDRLSHALAGGQRVHPNMLVPWADDPLEGAVPDEFRPDADFSNWFDPTVFAGAQPSDMAGVDLSSITPATGPGRDGKGLDFFRGGEAPNNYTNRHNPLYAARRQFSVAIASQLEEMFGVDAGGSAGYMRPPRESDTDPGGRSSNSDHYSGGALDLTGDPEKLTELRHWLVQQPWVSFVRWQSESHDDHLHVSIDLGWIAQNYFADKQIPALSAPPPQPKSSTPPPTVTSAPGGAGGLNVPV